MNRLILNHGEALHKFRDGFAHLIFKFKSIFLPYCSSSGTDKFNSQNRKLSFIDLSSYVEGKFGTSVLNPGAGFLRIFTVAFDRLF